MYDTPLAVLSYKLLLLCSCPGLSGCHEQVSSESPGFDVVYGDPSNIVVGIRVKSIAANLGGLVKEPRRHVLEPNGDHRTFTEPLQELV